MEHKILEVLRRMQTLMSESQLRELKAALNIVFAGCEIIEETGVRVMDRSWKTDLDDFLVSKALGGLTPDTVERYRYELTRLLSYINKAVADVTAGDISEYMQAYKRLCKVKNQTLKNVRAVYSSFFSWLRDRDRIRRNPIAMVEDIKVEKKIKEVYTDEERELLLRACKTLRDKAIVEFLYSTAVRVSELTKLNRDDVKFSTKDLVVFGKGKKERRVYLNERANLYLREYLQSRTDNNPALFVSLKKSYGRLGKDGVEQMIKRTASRAGIEKAYPHKFRRTSITNMINRGMPIQEAGEIAGHASTNTTKMYWTKDEEAIRYHHKIYLSA